MSKMETPEKVVLNLTIAGRKYSYKVEPELEEMVRSSCRDIGERFADLKSKYATLDNQEALSIILLQYVTSMVKYKRDDVSGTILREIKFLDDQLDNYIKLNIEK